MREDALQLLARRPAQEYYSEVMKAFRHPWPPIARNAAQAAIRLEMKDAVADLVTMFNEPDPAAQFTVKTEDGKEKTMIRELVRINHHRNCMLCHPPLSETAFKELKEIRQIPLGPVASMQDPMPPSTSVLYYELRKGITLVRADITYLRQDFSVMQGVKDHGKWPAQQRFDFVVRTREATSKDRNDRDSAATTRSPHRLAVLEALRGLTGKIGPPHAEAWQAEVAAATQRKKMSEATSAR